MATTKRTSKTVAPVLPARLSERVTIINLSATKGGIKPAPSTIYVGRPSPLGNPFALVAQSKFPTIKVSSSDEAIESFRKWLWRAIRHHNAQMEIPNHLSNHPIWGVKRTVAAYTELTRIWALVNNGSVDKLSCWCAPDPCHAEVILQAIDYLDAMARDNTVTQSEEAE